MENYKLLVGYVELEKEVAVGSDDKGVEHYPLFMGMCI